MTQYAIRNAQGEVQGFTDDIDSAPEIAEGLWAVAMPVPVVGGFPKPDSPTKTLHVSEAGALTWHETALLQDLVAQGIDDVDTSADKARAAVLVKQTQNEEYRVAERDAREYRAAGYSGAVPRGVSSWANAKHREAWTAQQAANDILATADLWINLLYTIRELRLAAKENIRHAVDGADIRAIVADFQANLAAAMNVIANA